mmetsp:Transcript_2498/g.5063  ORF Transcript_2498/g.5063 Transcript_2498/m.5063 type:complete len:633 (+) Transcript_2498:404-2302(+)
MKFLQVSALLAFASLVPGTLGNNKLVNVGRSGVDIIIEYLSTDSSGNLQVSPSSDLPGGTTQTGAVTFADMDGDGHLDLLRGDATYGWVSIVLNDGSDNFPSEGYTTLPSQGGGSSPMFYSVHGVDIDNDGHTDILASSANRGSYRWLNNGDGTFREGTKFSSTDNARRAYSGHRNAAADFNGDGYIDFVVGDHHAYAAQVYINDGSGGFLESYNLADLTDAWGISACDFDQDGKMDIVASRSANKNSRVYLNNGNDEDDNPIFVGVDLPGTYTTYSSNNGCADLNGDGYPDLVLHDTEQWQVFLNDGAGNFPTMDTLYPSPTSTGGNLALGDFDDDGDIDIASHTNIFLNNGDGTFGNPQGVAPGLADFKSQAFLYSASEPSSESPTSSPSSNPTTGSPSKTPTGSPTNAPTGSPTLGPTSAAAAGGALGAASGTGASPSSSGAASPSSSAADSLYYPDWTKSNGGCKTGGGQPQYMTLAPSTWMFATLDACCSRYYSWMLNDCKGTSGAAPSGLWYPDWTGPDDTCKNDGNEPQYMDLNPGAWMHSSKQACCEANFGWMLNGCLDSSGPNAGATGKWFMVWDGYKCKRDCAVGTGPSCGGRAESWEELFDTRSACCSTKAAWNPTDCLVD